MQKMWNHYNSSFMREREIDKGTAQREGKFSERTQAVCAGK
jgi:hypothetical protein